MNIGEMQRKLSLWAEQDKERKFHDLYALLCDKDWLLLAHDYVAQNAGSKTAGCDGITMTEFDADLENNLLQLQQALKLGTFEACPARRVYIPKKDGKKRPLGIPTIRDRIVQEAIRMILEPIYEADFSQYSFGFRPNRRTMDAIKCITWSVQERKKYFWIIEGDISAYFDTINHRKLIKLLKRRISDVKLIHLLRKFLKSGVMERKLFTDTKLGTPQGGIISPLLANVYLHELDKYMEKYTALPQKEKSARRQQGQANFTYVRYADDFVLLCNGNKAQAAAMKEELQQFLAQALRLNLSMEKTKVTHLDDGFDFLGFCVQRVMGHNGMKTKVDIAKKSLRKHLETIQTATSSTTHEDSPTIKIKALNRIIAGWCRYFQYTSRTAKRFGYLEHLTFWRLAHWLGRKYHLSMPQVMSTFNQGDSLGDGQTRLLRHSSFTTQQYKERFLKPNPYTTQERIEREELPETSFWIGTEARPGWYDTRQAVLNRDNYTCVVCKQMFRSYDLQVDHVRPYRSFKRPVDANNPRNLWTLCIECHKRKTEMDRQMESRMQ
jgi:RNA-directed DNA polymerase